MVGKHTKITWHPLGGESRMSSGAARGLWKQINRDVERILLDYPRKESTVTDIEWQFAWAIRELRRQVAEAQNKIERKEYIDNLGADGPQVGEATEGPYVEAK